ncbi:hypothetical protein BDV96DRAFT_566276 [Lophiotrema nucula]|uniref:Uncharacterized protein n=1 Tax=Lophiotrema nucula TaxID=690887 RepID=A0A6A5ZL59_9PLEO|nr:hypothetical protein BDV96DRAFT_566276 [Lophiotrema nucula]
MIRGPHVVSSLVEGSKQRSYIYIVAIAVFWLFSSRCFSLEFRWMDGLCIILLGYILVRPRFVYVHVV